MTGLLLWGWVVPTAVAVLALLLAGWVMRGDRPPDRSVRGAWAVIIVWSVYGTWSFWRLGVLADDLEIVAATNTCAIIEDHHQSLRLLTADVRAAEAWIENDRREVAAIAARFDDFGGLTPAGQDFVLDYLIDEMSVANDRLRRDEAELDRRRESLLATRETEVPEEPAGGCG